LAADAPFASAHRSGRSPRAVAVGALADPTRVTVRVDGRRGVAVPVVVFAVCSGAAASAKAGVVPLAGAASLTVRAPGVLRLRFGGPRALGCSLAAAAGFRGRGRLAVSLTATPAAAALATSEKRPFDLEPVKWPEHAFGHPYTSWGKRRERRLWHEELRQLNPLKSFEPKPSDTAMRRALGSMSSMAAVLNYVNGTHPYESPAAPPPAAAVSCDSRDVESILSVRTSGADFEQHGLVTVEPPGGPFRLSASTPGSADLSGQIHSFCYGIPVSVSVTARPDSGWVFTRWSGASDVAGAPSGAPCQEGPTSATCTIRYPLTSGSATQSAQLTPNYCSLAGLTYRCPSAPASP
jgi:hypothetical protein